MKLTLIISKPPLKQIGNSVAQLFLDNFHLCQRWGLALNREIIQLLCRYTTVFPSFIIEKALQHCRAFLFTALVCGTGTTPLQPHTTTTLSLPL